ncbi:MAG: hypothetical protein ABJB05_06840 [Parafilimonas sp.]
MRIILISITVLLLLNLDATCQVKIITGKVIDEYFDAVPYAQIQNSDSVSLAATDINGQFSISVPIETKSLLIVSISCEPTTVHLTDSCNQIDLIIMRFASYDYISLKKVDKLRMKRFKRLPKLHLAAYKKGIFKTSAACYTQDFISFN